MASVEAPAALVVHDDEPPRPTIIEHEYLQPQTPTSVSVDAGVPPTMTKEALEDLERHAQSCARLLTHMMGQLGSSVTAVCPMFYGHFFGNSTKTTQVTAEHLRAQQVAVDSFSDSASQLTQSVNNLMRQCQQIHDGMGPIYQLAQQMYQFHCSFSVLT